VLAKRRVLWDSKCRKVKREKGKAGVCSVPFSLFGVVRSKREDVDLITPPSALKACFPFPLSPFGF
jgi:hypothetical protein